MQDQPYQLTNLFDDFPELLREDLIWEREIFAHFGLLYMGFALLEHELINCCTIHGAAREMRKSGQRDKNVWPQFHDESFERCVAMTLGDLIKATVVIREYKDLQIDLLKIKKVRNYFSHHFFRREAAHMGDRVPALSLLVDMHEARISVKEVEQKAKECYQAYLVRIGLVYPDETYLAEESENLRREERDALMLAKIPRGIRRWLERGAET